MKIWYVYGLIFGIIGVAAGFLISFYVVGTLLGILWASLFSSTSWPGWSAVFMRVVFGSSWLLITALAVRRGIRFGARQQRLYAEAIVIAKVRQWFNICLIGLMALVIYLLPPANVIMSRMGWLRKSPPLAAPPLQLPAVIEEVRLSQHQEEEFDVEVIVAGRGAQRYRLDLIIAPVENPETPLLQYSETVELKFNKQSFHFPVGFEVLSRAYHEHWTKAIEKSSSGTMRMDAYLTIKSTLALADNETGSARLRPEGEKETVARFYFLCSQDNCTVEQTIPSEKQEENNK